MDQGGSLAGDGRDRGFSRGVSALRIGVLVDVGLVEAELLIQSAGSPSTNVSVSAWCSSSSDASMRDVLTLSLLWSMARKSLADRGGIFPGQALRRSTLVAPS